MIAVITNNLHHAKRYMEVDRKARFFETRKGYLPDGTRFEILRFPDQAQGRRGFTNYEIFMGEGPTRYLNEIRTIMESLGIPEK